MKRLLLALAALGLLAGCTTIPSGSSPEVVSAIPKSEDSQVLQANTGPGPNDGISAIMQGFLRAAPVADGGHSQARQFLTSAASRKWQDDTTIVLNDMFVHDPVIAGDTASVTISGRRVASVDATGVLTPTLKGSGTGDAESFSYTLDRRGGQWRVDSLPTGTLISSTTFAAYFHLFKIYFFNSTNAVLVPDLRYTPLQGQALASWMLTQLTSRPRTELTEVVGTNVPDQAGKPMVTYGDPIGVDMPGAAQLSDDERNSLAAQLAYTFGQVPSTSSGDVRLTDAGRPVRVPAVAGDTFSAAQFRAEDPDSEPTLSSFYVRDGNVYSTTGNGYATSSKLDSVAVRQVSTASQSKPVLAGVTESGRLVTGDPANLKQISLPDAPTSRPEWGPQGDDIWVGVGSVLYRVTNGQPARAITVTTPAGGPPTGAITAIRFSPDGVRVAMVIRPPKSAGTLWVGSVVTSGSSVRIDAAEPITPPLISVSDLAWADDAQLYALTTLAGSNAASVSELWSDGSGLTSKESLPGSVSATAVTAAPSQDVIVSANGLLYELVGSAWVNLGDNGPMSGTNPIYSS